MKNEIVNLSTLNPVAIFEQDGLEALLQKIKAHVTSLVMDPRTTEGRRLMASTGFWIARSKTTMDDAGKSLNTERDKKTKLVNRGRKYAREFCDDLKHETLRPKLEWEATKAAEEAEEERREKERLSDITHELENISIVAVDITTKTAEQLNRIMEFLYAYPLTEKVFEEFLPQAMERHSLAVERIEKQIEVRKQLDAEDKAREKENKRLEETRELQEAAQARIDKVAVGQKKEADRLADEKKNIEDAKRKIKEAEDRKALERKAKAEAKITAKKAEGKRIADEKQRTDRAAELLPDKAKATAYINALLDVPVPVVKDEYINKIITVEVAGAVSSMAEDAMELLRDA